MGINFDATCCFGIDHAAQSCPYQSHHDEVESLQTKLDRYKTMLDLSNEEFNTLEAYKERLELRLGVCIDALNKIVRCTGTSTEANHFARNALSEGAIEGSCVLCKENPCVCPPNTRRVSREELEQIYSASESQEHGEAGTLIGPDLEEYDCLCGETFSSDEERAEHISAHASDRQEPPDWAVELDDLRNGKD